MSVSIEFKLHADQFQEALAIYAGPAGPAAGWFNGPADEYRERVDPQTGRVIVARGCSVPSTIVRPSGAGARGVIREWFGPGECDVQTDAGTGHTRSRGLLRETHNRRALRDSSPE